jgi:hypothetical protein
MARTTLTRTTPLGPYPSLQPAADALDSVWTAADVANKNQFLLDGPVLLQFWNSGASPYTVTLTSAADPQNRTGDITTYSLAAGDIAGLKIDQVAGWKQSDGYMYLEASNASVKFNIMRLA